MSSKTNNKRIIFVSIIIIVAFLFSCQTFNKKTCCDSIEKEIYEKDDSIKMYHQIVYSNEINQNIGEPDLRNVNYESFRLIINSSFNNGTFGVIRMTKIDSFCTIKTYNLSDTFYSVYYNNKRINKHDVTILDSSTTKIDMNKWDEFQQLVVASNFWTKANNAKDYSNILDGTVFIIEASRPEAKKCNKKSYQIYGDVSPNDDDLFYHLCSWLETNSNLSVKH